MFGKEARQEQDSQVDGLRGTRIEKYVLILGAPSTLA